MTLLSGLGKDNLSLNLMKNGDPRVAVFLVALIQREIARHAANIGEAACVPLRAIRASAANPPPRHHARDATNTVRSGTPLSEHVPAVLRPAPK